MEPIEGYKCTGNTFFCTVFPNGASKKLQIQEYCSTSALLETPAFKKTVSRDRFLTILSMMYFSDNNLPKDEDRLRKIRKIVDHAEIDI